jgi:hypothetical protein
LADTVLPIKASSGGRTKYNRSRLAIAKSHALDAACVGEVATLVGWARSINGNKGDRAQGLLPHLDRHGSSRGYYTCAKRVRGFQTGDTVRAEAATAGHVAVRVTCSFGVGNADGINATYCKLLHRADGFMPRASTPAERALRLEHAFTGSIGGEHAHQHVGAQVIDPAVIWSVSMSTVVRLERARSACASCLQAFECEAGEQHIDAVESCFGIDLRRPGSGHLGGTRDRPPPASANPQTAHRGVVVPARYFFSRLTVISGTSAPGVKINTD